MAIGRVAERKPAVMVKVAEPLGGTVEGISTVTWYSPTIPGENPEKTTPIAVSPRATWGVTTVVTGGLAGAAVPKLKFAFTAPRPAM